MKKILYFLLVASLFSCTPKEPGYKITGTISGIDSAKIKLLKLHNGIFKAVDSVQSINGQFSFLDNLKNPDRYYIQLNDEAKYAGFFLENSVITIKIDKESFNKPIVKGSKSHDLYEKFETEFSSVYLNRIDSVRNLYNDVKNDNQRTNVNDLFDQKDREAVDFIIKFSKENSSSVVTPYIAYRYFSMLVSFNNSDLTNVLNSLDNQLNNTEVYKLYANWVNQRVLVEIGKPAIDFTMNNTVGNPISLFSINTQYLLIDFWSSKCGPCRKENPHLIKLYNKYKNNGFEILGVSFDDKREEWIAAIKKDKINWLQISSLTGWDNQARNIYGIEYIPQNVLIDKKGIIIAKNLNHVKLAEKLIEIFDN